MTTATVTNGRPARKQLSDQLDRLDSILDALAEGLPGAVADACREGARQAVKDAVVEILTNPELRGLLAGMTPAAPPEPPPAPPPEPAPAKPGFWARMKAGVKAVKDPVVGRCTAAAGAVAATCRAVSPIVSLRKVLL